MNEPQNLGMHYWSRAPGKFVNKFTGEELLIRREPKLVKCLKQIEEYTLETMKPKTVIRVFQEVEEMEAQGAILSSGPCFRGTVREWYETLVENVHELADRLEKETQCRATEVFAGPEVITIFEHTYAFHAPYELRAKAEEFYLPRRIEIPSALQETGKLSNRFTLYKNYNQPQNEIYVRVLNPEKPDEVLAQMTLKILDMGIL